jgi:hypothetical protein
MTATITGYCTMTNETQAVLENTLEAEIQALQANIEAEESATSEQPEAVETPDAESVQPQAEGDEFVSTESEKVQARINKLHWEKMEAKRLAEAERQARAELEQKLAEIESRSSQPQGKPRLAEFDLAKFDYNEDARLEAFNDALVKFNLNQMQQVSIAEQQRREREARQAEISNKYLVEVDSYAAKNPNYYQDIQNLPLLPPDKLDLLRNQGAKMVHYLSKNPDEAAKFANADLANAAFQLGTLSARLTNVKPTQKPSGAPEPVETITGSGKMTKDIGEMSMDEIMRT